MNKKNSHRLRSLVFPVWLAIFYLIWFSIVIANDLGQTILDNWGIATAMAAGSYVAGSTPMGGGTVGFPVLVLWFEQSGAMGRDFAFAIQSIGMVSASIYILTRSPTSLNDKQYCSELPRTGHEDLTQNESSGMMRRSGARRISKSPSSLKWNLIRPAMLGSFISTPIGILCIAPRLPDLSVKLIFAIIWASFGLMHLTKLREFVEYTDRPSRWTIHQSWIGFGVGLLGGLVSSITGVGIDMILYATMVLLFQSDLKTSTPSSVIAMAFTSAVGCVWTVVLHWRLPSQFQVDPAVFPCWLAAAPVVALGAPLGAWAVQKLPRTPTLAMISILCLIQFAWTLVEEQVHVTGCLVALGCVLVVNLLFHGLYRLGSESEENTETPPELV